MKKYKAPKLNLTTPRDAKTRLVAALRAVRGVERATLHPATNEFEIFASEHEEPTREEIAAAASGAGFALVATQSR